MKRWAKVLVAFVGASVLSIGAGRWHLSRSLPRLDGEVTLEGLSAPIDIVRDANAVPHIFAGSEADAYFALGYVHAQDRLWQMEFSRRLGAGTLSEIVGKDTLRIDRHFRTLGLRRVAEENLRALDPSTRALVDAYVRGVNAFLGEGQPLPPEFVLLRAEPKPWTAADSLVWIRVMAVGLAGNVFQELERVALSGKLTPKQIAEFLPPYPGDAPVPLPEPRTLYSELSELPDLRNGPDGLAEEARALLAELPQRGDFPVGSNNWAVDGTRTASGKPLLANDPHLVLSAPAVWYFAHLHAPGLNVIGATVPGLPTVILGRNEHVAWAFTNTMSDVQDLFVEKPAAGDPASYLTPSGPAPFTVREEILHIKGAPDETLRVRVTRHGPVVSDVIDKSTRMIPEGHVLALRSTLLEPDDRTVEFSIHAARAKNADELLAATKDYHSPQQNIVYADTDGAIGFIAAGRVPLRHPDNEAMGRIPVPGWIAKYDWTGFVPWNELPQMRQPASGRIVTANDKITPPGYPHAISFDWGRPYRAERIGVLLDASEKHTPASFERIQLDVHSGNAGVLLPYLLRIEPRDSEERDILERMRKWNAEMTGEALEPLVFAAWVRELARAVYEDELGELFTEEWRERAQFFDNVLANRDGQGRWCDDVRTPAQETCDEIVGRAFRAALTFLKKEQGSNYARWSWSAAHPIHSAHEVLGRVPVLSRWFNVDVPGAGDNETINLAGYWVGANDHPFVGRVAPGFRAIYDFADLERSTFVLTTGQSGHPLSPHYRDLSRLWSSGNYVPLRTDRRTIEEGQMGTLRLRPR